MSDGYIDQNNKVWIKSSDGTHKPPSLLDPNSDADRKALHGFAASLAKNLDGINKLIVITSKAGKDPSSGNPAFTSRTTIYLNSKGGFSKSFDDANNFKSILKHEIFHVDDNRKPKFEPSLSTHVDVYIKQMTHISFVSTSDDNQNDFKLSQIRSLAIYILNMDRKNKSNNLYTVQQIRDKISDFNNLNLHYKFVYPYNYNKIGDLTIKIKDINTLNTPEDVENTYYTITDEK